MKFYFLFLFLFSTLFGFPQISFDKTSYDFGVIEKGGIRYVDFKLTNHSAKTVYILRTDPDRELSIRYSKKTLEPDSSAIIRIQYNPKQIGVFNKKNPLYISSSNDPIILSIKGEIQFLEHNSLTECPDFSYTRSENPLQFDLNVHVIDTITNLPITNASVLLLKSGLPYKTFLTNEKGRVESLIQIGLYYVVVNADNYDTKEISIYLNRQHNSLVIYLHPLPPLLIVADTNKIRPSNLSIIQTEAPHPNLSITDSIKTIIVPKQEAPIVNIIDSILLQPLSLSNYAPNNIVFLIDVSTSMLNQGKLDLLKASMIQLLQPLRSIDKISIITYASNVNVMLQTTRVSDKESISQIIQNLEGGGLTAGDKGIAKAYDVCKQGFIAGGNNQIILATDGVFKIDQRTSELITQNVFEKITISVVGIKNSEIGAASMKNIAEQGKGHYLQINNYNDAKIKLIEEVKANSLRK